MIFLRLFHNLVLTNNWPSAVQPSVLFLTNRVRSLVSSIFRFSSILLAYYLLELREHFGRYCDWHHVTVMSLSVLVAQRLGYFNCGDRRTNNTHWTHVYSACSQSPPVRLSYTEHYKHRLTRALSVVVCCRCCCREQSDRAYRNYYSVWYRQQLSPCPLVLNVSVIISSDRA